MWAWHAPNEKMAKSSRKEIFLSYGREVEVIQFVCKLKQDLESNGFSVWLDTVDIPAGSDWHNAIGAGLNQCKAIIPIITKKYVASRYCMNEVSFWKQLFWIPWPRNFLEYHPRVLLCNYKYHTV